MLGILLSILIILALQSVFVNNSTNIRYFFSKSDLPVSYLVFKINPLISVLFTFVTYDLSYAKFLTILLLTTLLSLIKSLICQYLFYLLQLLT